MPLIEALQFPFRHFHQGFHHGVMPLAVLQGETVFSIDFILFKKPVIGQFSQPRPTSMISPPKFG